MRAWWLLSLAVGCAGTPAPKVAGDGEPAAATPTVDTVQTAEAAEAPPTTPPPAAFSGSVEAIPAEGPTERAMPKVECSIAAPPTPRIEDTEVELPDLGFDAEGPWCPPGTKETTRSLPASPLAMTPPGQREERFCERGGTKHGPYELTNGKGEVLTSGAFVKGQRFGLWKTYREPSKVMLSLGAPLGGPAPGAAKAPTGPRLASEGDYLRGKRVNLWTAYRLDGSQEWEAHYVDGKLHGARTGWDRKGEVSERSTYRHGKRVGRHRAWVRHSFPNERRFLQTDEHFLDGAKHGPYRLFFADGSLREEGCFDRGKRTERRVVHGKKPWSATYRNGKLHGELRRGNMTLTFVDGAIEAKPAAGLSGIAELSFGDRERCARTTSGQVWCWSGVVAPVRRSQPQRVAGIDDAVSISVSAGFACAALRSGGVRCWGDNTFGQLGDGTTEARTKPVAVKGAAGVLQVAAGRDFACGRRRDGRVMCWGNNGWHQLGEGPSLDPRPRAALVKGVMGATSLATDATSACVVDGQQQALCWGSSYVPFEPGKPMASPGTPPGKPLVVMKNVASVFAGFRNEGGCAITTSDRRSCWMGDETQRFAYGDLNGLEYDFVERIRQMSVSEHNACAVEPSGKVICRNPDEDFANDRKGLPVAVEDAVQVEVDDDLMCAVRQGGDVMCWGG